MLKVCLTGATGFIGKNLLTKLEQRKDLELVALSRKVSPVMDNAKKGNVTWRRCNGFSLLDVEKATQDVDILIYLIHSMLPSSTLSQGSFKDFDLYLADNFARAAKKNGIKKIIYLSGLIPEEDDLSEHLLSRREVEQTLSQYNNDLTVLRAGLIVGPNGSSFRILERLIKRLPALICPSWTLSKTQPIDLRDVIASLEHCINNSNGLNPVYDIGGPDILTYRKMLKMTARVLGKKRPIYNVPFFSPKLSKLWISKVASISDSLVYPLVDSLKHNMVVKKEQQLIIPDHNYIPFFESLEKGLSQKDEGWVRSIVDYNTSINFRWLENVTSLQRIENLRNPDSKVVSQEYFTWLPYLLRPLIKVKTNGNRVNLSLFNKISLLQLQKSEERSDHTRVVYYIVGGALARKSTMNGRLEFRTVQAKNCIVVALLDYRPSLPWFIYKFTQAIAHILVMKKFKKFLRKDKKKP